MKTYIQLNLGYSACEKHWLKMFIQLSLFSCDSCVLTFRNVDWNIIYLTNQIILLVKLYYILFWLSKMNVKLKSIWQVGQLKYNKLHIKMYENWYICKTSTGLRVGILDICWTLNVILLKMAAVCYPTIHYKPCLLHTFN